MQNDVDPELSRKCFVVLINEVVPRAKKLGITLNEFYDPGLLGWLVRCEHEGAITRKDLREILDRRVRDLNNV